MDLNEIIEKLKNLITSGETTLETVVEKLKMENKLKNADDETRKKLQDAIVEALGLDPNTPVADIIKAVEEALKESEEASETVADTQANAIEKTGFSDEFIGTGVGQHIFSWGHYLSNSMQDAETYTTPDGQLYEAEIPETYELLQWDKPFNEQSDRVKECIEEMISENPDDWRNKFYASDIYWKLEKTLGRAEQASKKLYRYGILGNEYNNGFNSEGNIRGFVLFDPNLVEITKTHYRRDESNKKSVKENKETGVGEMNKRKHISGKTFESYMPQQSITDKKIDEKNFFNSTIVNWQTANNLNKNELPKISERR